jgi:hypothetical protein
MGGTGGTGTGGAGGCPVYTCPDGRCVVDPINCQCFGCP